MVTRPIRQAAGLLYNENYIHFNIFRNFNIFLWDCQWNMLERLTCFVNNKDEKCNS